VGLGELGFAVGAAGLDGFGALVGFVLVLGLDGAGEGVDADAVDGELFFALGAGFFGLVGDGDSLGINVGRRST
jgi:hypothetical protein